MSNSRRCLHRRNNLNHTYNYDQLNQQKTNDAANAYSTQWSAFSPIMPISSSCCNCNPYAAIASRSSAVKPRTEANPSRCRPAHDFRTIFRLSPGNNSCRRLQSVLLNIKIGFHTTHHQPRSISASCGQLARAANPNAVSPCDFHKSIETSLGQLVPNCQATSSILVAEEC